MGKRKDGKGAAHTPSKKPRAEDVPIVDKEQEIQKRITKKVLELRKEVLGATNPRERALALANEALAKGTIQPSWSRKVPKSNPKAQTDEGMDVHGQSATSS